MRFGKIEGQVTNVFDTDQPGQDAWDLTGNLLLDSTVLGSTESGPALSLDVNKGW